MKRSFAFFTLALISAALFAQPIPRMAKYDIGETGMRVYLPADPGEFEISKSEDGSDIYTAEAEHGGFQFAVIAVDFSENMGSNKEELENLLTSYMDFLQQQFEISASAGYGMGHTKDGYDGAYGAIDFWEDAEGTQYAVKGWIDGDQLAVLILYGPKEYPHYNVQNMFLDGFRFSAED